MDLTNYKIAIVYSSITGNTQRIFEHILDNFHKKNIRPDIYSSPNSFNFDKLDKYDALIIGSYTWGDGEIPKIFSNFYNNLKQLDNKNLVTGIFGSGDSFYYHFCGAVDRFVEVLRYNTDLAVTLKVELFPNEKDIDKCKIFTEKILERLERKR